MFELSTNTDAPIHWRVQKMHFYSLGYPADLAGGGEIFRTRPDQPWGPPSLLYNGYRFLPGGKGVRGVTLTTHPHLVPRSWKRRAIPLLPLWVHVACYRVKPYRTLLCRFVKPPRTQVNHANGIHLSSSQQIYGSMQLTKDQLCISAAGLSLTVLKTQLLLSQPYLLQFFVSSCIGYVNF
jgi:hypothetical protein